MLEPVPVDISVLVCMFAGKLRDEMEEDGREMEQWVHSLVVQDPRHVIIQGHCWICGMRKARQLHHLAGKKHNDRVIPVCRICHSILSNKQKVWDHRWCQPDQPEPIREAFFLQGLQDTLRLKALETRNMYYERFADMFTEEISRRLRK
jgi:hypothetical protein